MAQLNSVDYHSVGNSGEIVFGFMSQSYSSIGSRKKLILFELYYQLKGKRNGMGYECLLIGSY